jgi:S-formylglutathione hydrolase
MKFAAFLPKNHTNQNLPVLIWLSGKAKLIFKYISKLHENIFFLTIHRLIKGLTCNEQNFITKSGFQQYASQHQIIGLKK